MRQASIAIMLIAVTTAGCSWSPGGARTTKSPPSMRQVTWPEAKRLIRTCQAKMVAQAHSLEVVLTLRDGRRVFTHEPSIDDINDVTFSVSGTKCPSITYATE